MSFLRRGAAATASTIKPTADELNSASAHEEAPTSVIRLLPRYSVASDLLFATASASFVVPSTAP